MKKYYYINLISIVLSLIIISCSSDTTTPVTPPPTITDSLIFQKDSLVAYSDSGLSSLAYYENISCSIKKFKISFQSFTNDSTNIGNIYSKLSLNVFKNNDTTVAGYYLDKRGNEINNFSFNQTITLNYIEPADIIASVIILFNNFSPNQHKWIKVINIKIYRTN
jgi:hypothetical protein